MSNSQEPTSTQAIANNSEHIAASESPLSQYQPMEDVASDVSMNISPGIDEDLKETAKANLVNLKNKYSIVYGHYLAYQKVNSDSENTRNAFAVYKDAEKQYLDAKDALAIFTSIHEPIKMHGSLFFKH
ncbi:hypothetical protein HPULCUR_012131 [Helicostylum pulchrum]|uniref:Uncharacterized protein n=1 Tax=Helicostylum pulchrum TaxID=562976 RepID=A0ABP9YI99_9FUNG